MTTFAEAIDAALPELRAMAESRMTSRAAVMRKTWVTGPDGYEVAEWAAVYVDVPFRLKGKGSRLVQVGGVEFSQADAEGHLPWPSDLLADDDLVEVTAGEWAGTVWRVVEAVKGDQRTARRFPVVEVARPEEWAA